MDADQQFCLRWNNHQSTLVSVFDTLLEKGTLVDCTIAAEGQFMKAHKVVLSACSPYFEVLLSQHYEKHPIVILKDVKFQELKAMMDYMYRGEVNISQDQLASILKVAESLQIKGLSESGGGNEKEVPEKKQEPRKSVPPQSTHASSTSQPIRNADNRKAPVTHSTPIAEIPTENPPLTPRPVSRDECPSPIARKRKKHRQYSNEENGANSLNDGLENSSSNELPPRRQSPPPPRRQSTPNLPNFPPPIAAISVPGKPLAGTIPTFKGKLEPETRASPKPVPPSTPIETEVIPKVEPAQAAEETIIEPKTEFVEEQEDIEDLTLDDDEEDMLDQSQPGPSHGGDLSNSGYEQWQMDQSQDDVFMAAQEAVGAQRDSQGEERRFLLGEVIPDIAAVESISQSEMEQLIIPETRMGSEIRAGGSANKLYDILSTSLEGKVILAHASQSGGMLQNSHRKQIAQLILAHELLTNPNRKISSEEFTRWAHKISQLFPKEVPSIYFTAYKASDQFRPKKNAGGKLYEAYISKRRKLRKYGEIPRAARTYGSSTTTASVPGNVLENIEFVEVTEDSDTQEKLDWLKNSVEPWHQVEMKWWQTSDARLRSLERERENSTVADYFNKFPALKTSNGFRLLLQDFSYIYPGKESIIYSTIVKYRRQIIKVAGDKIHTSRDRDFKAVLHSYMALTEDGNEETETNVALILLPYIVYLNPGKKKCNWKPTRSEARDGFITQIRSTADLESTVLSRKEKLINLGYPFQPLVMFVGNSVANVKAAYAVVDETYYKCDSLLAAVDLTFKIFHATATRYPEEAENVWLLIQLGLYNIETKYDRVCAGVNSLLVDLGIKAKE